MKKINILYWIFTGIFAGYMIFSAIPDALASEQAVMFIHDVLGYPVYFIKFIGVAKLLGCVAILLPGLLRIKEWAYAGLFFDLIGATYSILYVSPNVTGIIFMTSTIAVGTLSYYFYHRRLKLMRAGEQRIM